MKLCEPKPGANLRHLFDKAIDRPILRTAGSIGAAATELVPEIDRPLVAQPLEWFNVVARIARAAVRREYRCFRPVAELAPDHGAAWHIDAAFTGLRDIGPRV